MSGRESFMAEGVENFGPRPRQAPPQGTGGFGTSAGGWAVWAAGTERIPAPPTEKAVGRWREEAGAPSAVGPRAVAAGSPPRGGHGKVRVAFLTPTLLMGGAERWMIALARCCDPRRIEWTGTALCDGAPAHSDLCREMSAFMPVYAGPGTGPPGDPYVTRCRSARAALDAALGGSDVLVTWGVRDLAKQIEGYRIPAVFVSHGAGDWSVWTVRSSEPGATHFVAVSEEALEPFSPEVRQGVTVIHNGIDVERCTPTAPRHRVRAGWGFQPHHRLIGYVGRYSPEKNPLAAAHAARRLGGDYRAVYVGTGWKEAETRAGVAAVAGPRATFVPRDRQVGNALSAIDVFVLASPSEGFSLSLAEAWYCGVPVVATRVGAVPELERLHGQLVAPVPVAPSPEELAHAVEVALSPEFHSAVVFRAHEVVSLGYTARAMARRWTDYLCSVIGQGVPRSASSPAP